MALSRTVAEIDDDLQSRIAKLSNPRVFCTPLTGLSFELGQKKWNDGATRRLKRFKIGLAVQTKYRSVTDIQLAIQPSSHLSIATTTLTHCVAQVKWFEILVAL